MYGEKLIAEGVLSKDEPKIIWDSFEKVCLDALELSKMETTMKFKDWLDSPWSGFFEGRDQSKVQPTGIAEETLVHIGQRFSSLPPNSQGFVVHKGIERVLETRKQLVENRMADWSLGEAYAFGSLLKEGIHVRLSGQDVERGTFSHRHHVLHHQTIDKLSYRPLNYLYPDQAIYRVNNSSLSESGIIQPKCLCA